VKKNHAGLGLNIAEIIAGMHGDGLQLSNRQDGGIIVILEIPFQ